jgi:hypothetical protein
LINDEDFWGQISMSANSTEETFKKTYLIYPQWGIVFFLMGGVFLLLIGLSASFLFGISATSDRVFATEALFSGILVEIVLKKIFKRRLVISPKVEIPFIYIWPLLCLYVFIVRPFE